MSEYNRIYTERREAYDIIRHQILRGEWAPGQLMTERAVAERIKKSRTAGREALAVLEATGLVIQSTGKTERAAGVEVRHIVAGDARQSLRFRIGMETEIAAECARVRKPVSDELYSAIGGMATALHQGEQIEYMLADTRFHVGLARRGGFSSALTALEGMRDRLHLYRLQNECLLLKPQMLAVLDEHTTVLAAIESGDPGLAREAMRQHTLATAARIED